MTRIAADAALDRMEADPAFGERIKVAGEAGRPDDSLAILRDQGFDVTTMDMRDALIDRYGDALSAEQLDALAGGIDNVAAAFIAVGGTIVGIGGAIAAGSAAAI